MKIPNSQTVFIMSDVRKLWGSVALGTFAIFYFMVPEAIYDIAPTTVSIVGGAVFTLSFLFFLSNSRNFHDFYDTITKGAMHRFERLVVIGALLMLFMSLTVFRVHADWVTKMPTPIMPGKVIEVDDSEKKKRDSLALIAQTENRTRQYYDSLVLAEALEQALEIAYLNINEPSFNKAFITQNTWERTLCEVSLKFGHLFSGNYSHLLIKRVIYGHKAQLDIYTLRDGKFKQEVSSYLYEYIGEEVKDINGDGARDYAGHMYGSNGCCRRDIYLVHIYSPDDGTFNEELFFMNPTFSPEEKIVRGVEYGHPGQIGMYKFRWNGSQLDTIEYIFPNIEDTIHRTYLRVTNYQKAPEKKQIIKVVPMEYRRLDHYNWFNDY